MSTQSKVASVLVTAALVAAVPAWAHHSFSIFDAEQTKTFTGVVTRVNPDANHLQIFFAPMNDGAQERRAYRGRQARRVGRRNGGLGAVGEGRHLGELVPAGHDLHGVAASAA